MASSHSRTYRRQSVVVQFLCNLDFSFVGEIMRDMREDELLVIALLFIPLVIWEAIMSLIEKIHELMGQPFPNVSKYFYSMILPAMFIVAPFFDLSGYDTILTVFLFVGLPFAVFYLPVFEIVAREYVKEHPEYRKIFIFGRGGAARWGGIYSFIKYDFNDFMNGRETKHAPIYCGKTLWHDDIKVDTVFVLMR